MPEATISDFHQQPFAGVSEAGNRFASSFESSPFKWHDSFVVKLESLLFLYHFYLSICRPSGEEFPWAVS